MRIAVLGVGLIGGSIGLAARARAGAEVCGYDTDPVALRRALELRAIDRQAPDIATAVAGAQVVFAATPVGALADTVSQALTHAGPDCVVSDVGSTKLALDDARHDPRFFGGHPIAGAETTGVAHAREDMFEGASWYLTADLPTKDPDLLDRLLDLIGRLGAHPRTVSAAAHDRLMACISHLPHVFANVLAVQALATCEREGSKPIAGPSLRDAIRVAGANTAIWTDIYLANGPALIAAIDEVAGGLEQAREMLTEGDAGALAAWNERAQTARQALLGDEPADPFADA